LNRHLLDGILWFRSAICQMAFWKLPVDPVSQLFPSTLARVGGPFGPTKLDNSINGVREVPLVDSGLVRQSSR
jgi:hypothetical protein